MYACNRLSQIHMRKKILGELDRKFRFCGAQVLALVSSGLKFFTIMVVWWLYVGMITHNSVTFLRIMQESLASYCNQEKSHLRVTRIR